MSVEAAVNRLLDVSSRHGLQRALLADHDTVGGTLPTHTLQTPERGVPRCPRCGATAR